MSEVNISSIFTIPQHIAFDPEINRTDMQIYMIINSFMYSTGEAYPSNGWLAEKLNAHEITVSKSISKMVKKGYITRYENDNGKRYLHTGRGVPEDLVSSRGVSVDAKGGKPIRLGGVSVNANRYRSDISKSDNNNAVVVDKLFEDSNKVIPKPIFGKLLNQHSEQQIRQALNALNKASNVRNPEAWLTSALTNNYQPSEPQAAKQASYAVPNFEETMAYLNRIYKPKKKKA